jgi:O-methyltransferase
MHPRIKSLPNSFLKRVGYQIERRPSLKDSFPELQPWQEEIIKSVRSFTMTSPESLWALLQTIHYVEKASIDGDIVECGVWRGGNMLLAKQASETLGHNRNIWMFDTFAGMSEPTEQDRKGSDQSWAVDKWHRQQEDNYNNWCYASLEDVRNNFSRLGALDDSVHFVQGKVEDTLRDDANLPAKIAILRLDTDWYESTKIELKVLYPRVPVGGIVIVDDYGHWLGARQAVDEYFSGKALLLHRVDYTCRMFVKTVDLIV